MFIPDPNISVPESEFGSKGHPIQDPLIEFFVFLTPKKLLLSSWKYDPGCFFPDPGPGFLSPSRIPDPWV
jgi:hypothetical protein